MSSTVKMSGKDIDWKKIARDEEITKQLRWMGGTTD